MPESFRGLIQRAASHGRQTSYPWGCFGPTVAAASGRADGRPFADRPGRSAAAAKRQERTGFNVGRERLHIVERQRRNRGRRRIAQRGITRRQQTGSQRSIRLVPGTLHLTLEVLGSLALDHLERLARQGGMQHVVGKQLDSAREISLQDAHGEVVSRGLARGDVIERLTLYMNRVRQASITKEIIEVVSGAAAAAE